MTQVFINEETVQGKRLLSLIKTMPKKVVTLNEEEDLSDCISSSEFEKMLLADLKSKYKNLNN